MGTIKTRLGFTTNTGRASDPRGGGSAQRCRSACLGEIMTEKNLSVHSSVSQDPPSRIRNVSVWLEMTNRLEKRKHGLNPHPPPPPQICLLRLNKPPQSIRRPSFRAYPDCSLRRLVFAFHSLFLCLLSESTRLLWPCAFRVHLWLPTGRAPIDQVTRGGRVEEWRWGQLGVRDRDEPMTRMWSPPHQDAA